MRDCCTTVFCLGLFCSPPASAQENDIPEIRYLFSAVGQWTPAETSPVVDEGLYGTAWTSYTSAGVLGQNRFFFENVDPLVANLSVGASWFGAGTFSRGGVAEGRYDDFVAIPISIGPELFFSKIFGQSVHFLVGGGVDANAISSKQNGGFEWGLHVQFSALLGNLELGCRYTVLSYIETLGLQLGLASNFLTLK